MTRFFYAAHPPVPGPLRDAAFAQARAFSSLPPDRKAAVSIARSGHNRGYVGHSSEALDPERGADHKEAFNIGLDLPPEDPDVRAGRPFRSSNLRPDLPCFRDTALAYYDTMLAFGRSLHRGIAVDLGLPAAFFDDKLRRPLATLRLLHYAAGTSRTALEPSRLGAGTHNDYGNLTLLATNAVGGLEIRARNGEWLETPDEPDALTCDIGDCLMRWTNDVYVSTPHRVVSPSHAARYSIAFFVDADPDAVVEPLDSCIAADRPARYPPTTVADHFRARLDATYGS